VITGSSAAAMMRPDVIEVERRGSLYYGLQLSDFTGAISSDALAFRVFQPTVLTATPVTVPATFMGMTVENVGNGANTSTPPWALGMNYGIHRLLAFGTYWPDIETSDNSFNWNKMDQAVDAAFAEGKEIMWNVAYTPGFHNTNVHEHRSSGQNASAGWAGPPDDLAASMQTYPALNSAKWGRFVRAAVQRYAGKIKYYVMWNEPNYRRYANPAGFTQEVPHGNWFDSSDTGVLTDLTTVRTSVSGNQNYTQFVRMQADLYGIVHEEDPDAVVIGPDFFGELSSQGTGGKQDGATCFAAWLAAGGASYCDAYGWHAYMDEGEGIEGVSKRLVSKLQELEQKRVAAGAPVKPWHNTETGHEALEDMSLDDQKLWLGRNVLIHAALGWKSWSMYVWDSLNPATTQMSLWAPANFTNPGLRPIAQEYNRWAGILQGATITYAAILNNGKVCATINGIAYIV
jgi:hypothetical protein